MLDRWSRAGIAVVAALLLGARSSPIATSASRVVAVNPDSASVTVMGDGRIDEIRTGGRPQTVAVIGELAYVASREGALSVIDLARGVVERTVDIDRDGYGVAVDAERVYFTSPGTQRLHVLDRMTFARIGTIATEPYPAGIATDEGHIYVTHLRTGRVSVIDAASLEIERVIATAPDSNVSASILIHDGRAYLPQTRANVTNPNILFDSTVFPIVSVIDLAKQENVVAARIDIHVADRPVNLPLDAVVAGNKLYVVNAGSDDVSVFDFARTLAVAHIAAGSNPRGIASSADGRKVYVDNTLSGTVSVIDVATDRVIATIATTKIPLPSDVLNGKILFHTSSRPEMAKDRWISCSTCHFEGADGRTWLMRDGPRNTPALYGAGETLPGHWSADMDELEDAEASVRGLLGGTGLAPGASNCDPSCELGPPNHGRSKELDDLALYVRTLQPPPYTGDVDVNAAARGQRLFSDPRLGCAACHASPLYTDRKMHDVGTATSPLERRGSAFDTPSLRGVYATAPYFHDGSAPTLREVLDRSKGAHGNVSSLDAAEIDDLIAFLQSLRFPVQQNRRRSIGH